MSDLIMLSIYDLHNFQKNIPPEDNEKPSGSASTEEWQEYHKKNKQRDLFYGNFEKWWQVAEFFKLSKAVDKKEHIRQLPAEMVWENVVEIRKWVEDTCSGRVYVYVARAERDVQVETRTRGFMGREKIDIQTQTQKQNVVDFLFEDAQEALMFTMRWVK